MVFEESPLCALRSKSENHNGCIVHSSVWTFVGLLAGWPRGIANLVGPCVVQFEVDPLRTPRDVVQRIAQHLSVVRLDGPTLFQQHVLSCVVPCFPIITLPKRLHDHFWPAKVSGWWDGQHSGNQGKLKNIPL